MATKISLKLLLNKDTQKVLFAEAGKDFVDFLISLLALPLGTIIQLLNQKQMVGCLGKLYASLEALNTTYLQSGIDMDLLLNPRTSSPGPQNTFLLQSTASASSTKRYYRCPYDDHAYVTDIYGTQCPSCSGTMVSRVRFVAGKVEDGEAGGGSRGYVKGVVTYHVMDDLVVSPMSTISSITLLNKFQVKEVGALEERTVEIGMDEALKLLKASLHSTTVLTDVLLEKK